MAKQGTLLVVDDNQNILTSLQYLLSEYFDRIITLGSPVTIPSLFRQESIDVVLLDMNFSSGINSGNEGLYWLREIKRLRPQTQVVLFTAYADIDLAVTGIKEGASDFVVKPWDNAKLVRTLVGTGRRLNVLGKLSGNSPVADVSGKGQLDRCEHSDNRRERYGKRYAGARNPPPVKPAHETTGYGRHGSHYRIIV